MSASDQSEQFVRQLTACQNRLYGYIYALLPDANGANDVLQETNVVLWRKSDQFEPGTNFAAWASRVAYLEVLAYRKRKGHDRHVFDDALLGQVADAATKSSRKIGGQQAVLRECMEKLSDRERRMVTERYGPGGSVQQIAATVGRSVGAISQMLYRIRLGLLECVRRNLSTEQD